MPTDKTQYTKQYYEKILFNSPEIKFFFTVSLPAAFKTNEVPGHILFVCQDALTTEYFIELLRIYNTQNEVKDISINQTEQCGEIGAVLTSLKKGAMLIHTDNNIIAEQNITGVLTKALDTFSIDIVIGKGKGARNLLIDIVPFTFVCCVKRGSETLDNLMHCFEYILTVNSNESQKICDGVVQSEIENAGLLADKDTCSLISSKARYQSNVAARYARRIAEYVHATYPEEYTIRTDHAEEVFRISGMMCDPEPAGTEEIYSMLRNINDSLHMIKKELSSIGIRLDMLEDINRDVSSIESKINEYEI